MNFPTSGIQGARGIMTLIYYFADHLSFLDLLSCCFVPSSKCLSLWVCVLLRENKNYTEYLKWLLCQVQISSISSWNGISHLYTRIVYILHGKDPYTSAPAYLFNLHLYLPQACFFWPWFSPKQVASSFTLNFLWGMSQHTQYSSRESGPEASLSSLHVLWSLSSELFKMGTGHSHVLQVWFIVLIIQFGEEY